MADWWNPSYAGAPVDGSAWQQGNCERRGFRGGAYGDIPMFARSTLRSRPNAHDRKDDIGFRLVLGKDGGRATTDTTGRPAA